MLWIPPIKINVAKSTRYHYFSRKGSNSISRNQHANVNDDNDKSKSGNNEERNNPKTKPFAFIVGDSTIPCRQIFV